MSGAVTGVTAVRVSSSVPDNNVPPAKQALEFGTMARGQFWPSATLEASQVANPGFRSAGGQSSQQLYTSSLLINASSVATTGSLSVHGAFTAQSLAGTCALRAKGDGLTSQ